MTSHTNCTHPATKSARAACRKGAAAASSIIFGELHEVDPMTNLAIPHLAKVRLAEDACPYEALTPEWHAFSDYIDNAYASDSAFWVNDTTAASILAAALDNALDEDVLRNYRD